MTDCARRLVQLVRRNDADLAEAALLCAKTVDPDVNITRELLRVDALADAWRTHGFTDGAPHQSAMDLAAYLGGNQGFIGDTQTYYKPENALLHRVLDTKRGLPISLAIVYAAIARRVNIPAFAVHLPGHVVAGIASEPRPVILDPFAGGIILDEDELVRRVHDSTAGRIQFHRAMLRPAPAVNVTRRLLNNLVRDLTGADRAADALRAMQLKLALPNALPEDHRTRGKILASIGQYGLAADAFERYIEMTGPDAPGRDKARQAAIQARARLN